MTPYVTKIKKDKIRTPLPVVYLINVFVSYFCCPWFKNMYEGTLKLSLLYQVGLTQFLELLAQFLLVLVTLMSGRKS